MHPDYTQTPAPDQPLTLDELCRRATEDFLVGLEDWIEGDTDEGVRAGIHAVAELHVPIHNDTMLQVLASAPDTLFTADLSDVAGGVTDLRNALKLAVYNELVEHLQGVNEQMNRDGGLYDDEEDN